MQNKIDLISASYGRCILSEGFFEDFYETFQKSDPRIKAYFTDTDMSQQRRLLRHGISYMIMYAEENRTGELKVEKLGDSHSETQMNIKPELYDFWIQSLVETIRKHDSKSTPELESDWKQILNLGVNKMKDAYLLNKN